MHIFLLCLAVFFSRIIDVSLGTVRTIFTVKRKALIAACIGFIEVLVWFLIAREALAGGDSSIWIAISYSAGYATGTFVGGMIAKLVVRGVIKIQVVTSSRCDDMLAELKEKGFALTVLDAYGQMHQKEKYMIYLQIDSKYKKEVTDIIKKHDPHAFITINEIQNVYNGYFREKSK